MFWLRKTSIPYSLRASKLFLISAKDLPKQQTLFFGLSKTLTMIKASARFQNHRKLLLCFTVQQSK